MSRAFLLGKPTQHEVSREDSRSLVTNVHAQLSEFRPMAEVSFLLLVRLANAKRNESSAGRKGRYTSDLKIVVPLAVIFIVRTTPFKSPERNQQCRHRT